PARHLPNLPLSPREGRGAGYDPTFIRRCSSCLSMASPSRWRFSVALLLQPGLDMVAAAGTSALMGATGTGTAQTGPPSAMAAMAVPTVPAGSRPVTVAGATAPVTTGPVATEPCP